MTDRQTTSPASTVEISWDDVPLHCPMPGMTQWNAHPRVFLPIDESGEELCPYCGTLYRLRNFEQKPAHHHG
ncbi:MAG: zinc-finger domain-containing protein [Gammaproteobacteria bacterium]|nr:zinc-finger domain-containing protein [Gammaproteobacteria bacterium]